MKNFFSLTILFLSQFVSGQADILTKIPGTKCSLIPPIGFISTNAFSGFQNTAIGASIIINEVPASYTTLIAGFTEDALLDKGMQLKSKEIIELNENEATLFRISQRSNGINYIKDILIFGNEDYTVLVNGTYPEGSKLIEPTIANKIKIALLSTVYDLSQEENPRNAVTFSIDTEGTAFIFTEYVSGSLLYSTDGKIPTEKPTIIVSNSFSKIDVTNKRNYAEEHLKELLNGSEHKIIEINEVTIDNMQGYEIIANGKNKDEKDELAYQVMLFNGEGDYYIFFGLTTEEFDLYLESFKVIAKTFKLK
jgi:hypothetical protein